MRLRSGVDPLDATVPYNYKGRHHGTQVREANLGVLFEVFGGVPVDDEARTEESQLRRDAVVVRGDAGVQNRVNL